MNTPTFYEQVGIVIPGAVLLFGLLLFFPELQTFIGTEAVSLGEFGIFFLLSYATGHLVAAIGNFAERIGWSVAGGMPSDWVIKEATTLISRPQRELLELKIRSRLGVNVSLSELDRRAWSPISRQLYADVMQHGKADRVDTFDGNYGLNRGLAAACFAMMCVAGARHNFGLAAALALTTAMYGYRAYRFGVHYARELYVQFLAIDAATDGGAQQ